MPAQWPAGAGAWLLAHEVPVEQQQGSPHVQHHKALHVDNLHAMRESSFLKMW